MPACTLLFSSRLCILNNAGHSAFRPIEIKKKTTPSLVSVGLTTRIIIHHLTFKDIIARFFFFFFKEVVDFRSPFGETEFTGSAIYGSTT